MATQTLNQRPPVADAGGIVETMLLGASLAANGYTYKATYAELKAFINSATTTNDIQNASIINGATLTNALNNFAYEYIEFVATKGQPDGFASLDSSGILTAAERPNSTGLTNDSKVDGTTITDALDWLKANISGGLWVEDANGINSDNARVAIGQTVPVGSDILTTNGDVTFNDGILLLNRTDGVPIGGITASTDYLTKSITYSLSNNKADNFVELAASSSDNLEKLSFRTNGSGVRDVVITHPGDIGFGGKENPTELIDIKGNATLNTPDNANTTDLLFKVSDLKRWGISRTTEAETGSNAGSNFAINRYSDTGDLIGAALHIDRADGFTGLNTTMPKTLLDVNGEISVAYNATYGVRFYNEDGNNWSSIGNDIATGSTAAHLVFKDSTGERMRLGDGKINMSGLPTSASGLSSGDIWNDAGTLKIV